MTTAEVDSATIRMTLARGTPGQRVYVLAVRRTMAQDIWMTRLIRKAGLDRLVLTEVIVRDEEQFTAFLTNMVTTLFEADLVGDLIAGMLVREGAKWRTEDAEDTRNFVLGLDDDEEKKQVFGLMTGLLHHFLSSGRTRSGASDSSSAARDARSDARSLAREVEK